MILYKQQGIHHMKEAARKKEVESTVRFSVKMQQKQGIQVFNLAASYSGLKAGNTILII
jgi:hypothetical protein